MLDADRWARGGRPSIPQTLTRERYSMAAVIRGTKRVPRVSATTFAEYLTAGASSKIDCVKDQIRIYDQP
jgi:hypothetical protein